LKRLGTQGCFVVATGIVLLAIPLAFPNPYLLDTLILGLMYGILAASWDLLGGYTGQLSFGHAGFLALGAYCSAILTQRLGLSPWLGLPAGGLFTALVGTLIGIPVLRLRGQYLAIVTLGFSEVIRLIAQNWVSLTGGPYGIHEYVTFPGFPEDPRLVKFYFYYTALGLLVVCGGAMYFICERTQIGKAFKSIREDQILAESLGIHTTFYKVLGFSLSCFFAGIAGAFYAYYVRLVSPYLAESINTVWAVGMVILGGLGTLIGPIYGALLLYGVYQAMRFVGVVYNLIAVGAVILIFVTYFPNGIWGVWDWASKRWSRKKGDRNAYSQRLSQ
jgi:branched-chain amino acid transport system permease protein